MRERVPGDRRMRALPSVERLAARLDGVPASVAVAAARQAVSRRRSILAGDPGSSVDDEQLRAEAQELADELATAGPRRVINATGVIVHTNLGRAPLSRAALDAVAELAGGYSDLELRLDTGERGSRQEHVARPLASLTGAESALVVNNCAAAVLLACAALGAGREIVVSRGQLVEIGGAFRVPDIIAQSGARLVEVGTTNRTRIEDYEAAVGPDTAALLRVHPSNFRTLGFTEQVEIEQLCDLARATGVEVIDDVGSGVLATGRSELADEPPARRSVAAGAALTCFSGDKLLGGPQAGILVGTEAAVERARRHPLARALRIDKLSLAALGATIRLHQDPAAAAEQIPVLAMLGADPAESAARAQELVTAARAEGAAAEVVQATGRAGGGALPLLELEGPACAITHPSLPASELAAALRRGAPPVLARISGGRVLLDPRTMSASETTEAAALLTRVLAAVR